MAGHVATRADFVNVGKSAHAYSFGVVVMYPA
jgi:hypothetical protein